MRKKKSEHSRSGPSSACNTSLTITLDSSHPKDQSTQAIIRCNVSQIHSLTILQRHGYALEDFFHSIVRTDPHIVVIPANITRLAELETITICACIEELPALLSEFRNLKLLDLTECYTLLFVPEVIYHMPNLKIKIGPIVSSATTLSIIGVPWTEITPDVFFPISSAKPSDIQHIIIRQKTHPPQNLLHPPPNPEAFELPSEMQRLTNLKHLSVHGSLS